MKKPRVITKCVADKYSLRQERIIEFAGTDSEQGGLISFVALDDGTMLVYVYRHGAKVKVKVGKRENELIQERRP